MKITVYGAGAIGAYLIYEAQRLGIPRSAVIRMIANIAVDTAIGAIPVAGDIWDFFFRANDRNMQILARHVGGLPIDGFDLPTILRLAGSERLGWLILMPGAIDRVIDGLRQLNATPRVGLCGVMADLVPAHQIAEVTRLLNAPYANTFGATETGTPPASAGLLPVGELPASLDKQRSSFVELRLVDVVGRPDGRQRGVRRAGGRPCDGGGNADDDLSPGGWNDRRGGHGWSAAGFVHGRADVHVRGDVLSRTGGMVPRP